MSPFAYLNAINSTKQQLIDSDGAAEGYVPFVVNRSLSYFPDTVLLANEINKYHHVDNTSQFLFLLNSVRKRKRFSKWHKPSKHEDVEAVKLYYGYSTRRAVEAIQLLSEQQLQEIREKTDYGGKR